MQRVRLACACCKSPQESIAHLNELASTESANPLRFLWTALSTESAALSIESPPIYRMVGFLGIARKYKFLESAEHIYIYISVCICVCTYIYILWARGSEPIM